MAERLPLKIAEGAFGIASSRQVKACATRTPATIYRTAEVNVRSTSGLRGSKNSQQCGSVSVVFRGAPTPPAPKGDHAPDRFNNASSQRAPDPALRGPP